MGQPIHKIGIHRFHLNFTSERPALEIHKQIAEMVDDRYLNQLDQVLTKYCLNGKMIHIDRIEVNLKEVSISELPGIFRQKMLESIEKLLKEDFTRPKILQAGVNILLQDESWSEELLFFLKTGQLPWWSAARSLEFLENALISNKSLQSGSQFLIKGRILEKEEIRKRLAWQFSEHFQLLLMKSLFPDFYMVIETMMTELPKKFLLVEDRQKLIRKEELKRDLLFSAWNRLSAEGSSMYREEFAGYVILDVCRVYSIPLDVITPQVHALISKESMYVLEKRQFKNDPAFPEEDTFVEPELDKRKSYLVNNAGIVILWPFLEKLFEKLEYMADGRFINTFKQERAVGLTGYLVTGEEKIEEHALLLNKIITGWPLGKPLKNQFYFSEEEKEECQQLLKDVTGHWTVLKNTSVEGLRETFLLRNGKVSIRDNEYILRVERTGVDVLLDQLPWPIGFIKFPWTKSILYVEW